VNDSCSVRHRPKCKSARRGSSIVIVNITEFRSDAIIITPAIVKAISLSELSASDTKV
jgi:hypothetical protein